jgi:hypothetical protein
MRLYSTPQSAEAQEVSVLVVVETLLAVGGSLWLAVKLGSWTHVAIGAALAPLVLLRTPESTRLGLWWAREELEKDHLRGFKRLTESWDPVYTLTLFLLVLIAHPVALIVLMILLRLRATAVVCMRFPGRVLPAIIGNWRRVCFCTDIAHLPEMVPGSEVHGWRYRLSRALSLFRKDFQKNELSFRVVSVVLGVYLLLFYVPAYLYRLSIKCTALVWAPLLWVVPKSNPRSDLKTRLEQLCQSSFARLVFLLSIGTLGFCAFKIALYAGFSEVSAWWNGLSFSGDLKPLVEPDLIPRWQLASAVTSVIALGLYFYADWTLIQIRNDDLGEGGRKFAEGLTRTGAVVCTTLSLYSISSVLYIVSRVAWEADWLPRLGDRWFPWG